MDDSCAVCAESLEWVAYGACSHREVCSTCVARLRFICEDRRCCICKTESDTIFVTKALGDYTRTISDFSVFPSDAKEGRNELYWFHEAMGAYFDDLDQYKMIKAMCKLSCSVCDKAEEQGGNEGHRKRGNFRNIEQLKKHLFFDHHLHMCSLCLEGRKVFICEQKLYTRAQLNQHIKTGDSEVDGSESERGGFMGHPSCEFCRKPFYGDNELYSHMSTEHYTCHICQRQHPGQFEYYKNYDDLEMHFRQLHFLCEDEGCLAKKFIVFSSESEMKRHNAIEHGGNMSRSKRNSALQIPTSFRYRRSSEDDRRGRGGRGRGRGFGFRSDSSDNQLSMAIEASLETANVDNTIHDHSSNVQAVPQQRENIDIDEIVPPFESLSTTDSEARYLQALGQSSRNAPLQESSFPPLPMAPPSSQQQLKHESEGPAKNTMAARLRRRNKGSVNVLNSGRAWPATNSNSHARPRTNHGFVSSSSHANTSQVRPAVTNGPILSSYANLAQARPATGTGLASASSANTAQPRPAATAPMPSSYANLAQARPATGNGLASASSANSWNAISTARISHSASAPNLVQRGSLDSSMSDFPPVSATLKTKPLTSSVPVVEDVQIANKSLVEMIRSALEFDEDRYSAFKVISSEYRQGVMGTVEYLSCVQQFGLSHLVLELARLCPDPNKQRELLETYNASVRSENARRSGSSSSNLLKASKSSNKGKGKIVEQTTINSKDLLADSIINTVRQLQANYKPSEDVEVLSKDGYRSSKGKSKAFVSEEQLKPISANRNPADSNGKSEIESSGVGSYQNPGGGGGGGGSGKQKKKSSKFHRVRLGEDSAAALINGRQTESDQEETSDSNQNSSEGGLPVRGVWRNGGGQKLVSLTQKDTLKR